MGDRRRRRSRRRRGSGHGRRARRGRGRPLRRDARACDGPLPADVTPATSRTTDEQEALCRAALPLEEERADPRRLALLWWPSSPTARNFRMRIRRERCRLRAGAPLLPPRRRLSLDRRAGARLGADPRPAPGGRGAADARRARRRPASRRRRTSAGRCCSRCSAASTRRGRSPRRGRTTCARSAAAGHRRTRTSR